MNGIFIRHILDVYWIINDNNYIIYTVYASKSDTRRMLMCNYAKRRKVCHERERGSKIKVGRASHIKAIEYLIPRAENCNQQIVIQRLQLARSGS